MANGLEEYYTGAGEAPGVWVGTRVESLGLVGEVEPAHLRAVRAGLTPRTGLTPDGTTLHAHPRQVPGFDLMFSVPKSVSVAYALANRRVQHLIVTACEATLAETLGWLEREACFVRRRTNKPAERARFYDAVGISGTYEPQVNRLILTTHPVAHMVRVGGPVGRVTYRSLAPHGVLVNSLRTETATRSRERGTTGVGGGT